MREYNPERWVLCQLKSMDGPRPIHYRILAGWYGGFTSGDSWKLSSGVLEDKISMDEKGWFVSPQSSGSCYILQLGSFGMSGYMSGVAASFMKEAANSNGKLEFTVLTEDDTMVLLNTMVKSNA